MYLKTDGIVLKRTKVSDSDSILTLLTRKSGKISVSVKGSRHPKSKLVAGSQGFIYGEFMISMGKTYNRLTSVDIKEAFYPLREDFDSLMLASFLAELTNIVTVEGVTNNRLFSFLIECLYFLCSGNKDKYDILKVVFELKLLDYIGYRPEMNRCVNCGSDGFTKTKFSVTEGGVICQDCFHSYPDDLTIGSTIPKLMNFILTEELETIVKTEINPIFVKKVDFLVEVYLKYYLERKGFKSLSFMKSFKEPNKED